MAQSAVKDDFRLLRKRRKRDTRLRFQVEELGGKFTDKTLQQLREEFSGAPTSQKEYEIKGKRYIVTSHYTGKKDVNKVIGKIALKRAYSDMDKLTA